MAPPAAAAEAVDAPFRCGLAEPARPRTRAWLVVLVTEAAQDTDRSAFREETEPDADPCERATAPCPQTQGSRAQRTGVDANCETRVKTELLKTIFLFPFLFFLNLICALCCSCWNKSFIYCIELGVAPLSSPACIWACRRHWPTPVAAPAQVTVGLRGLTQGRPACAGLR